MTPPVVALPLPLVLPLLVVPPPLALLFPFAKLILRVVDILFGAMVTMMMET
jgi:hypothetical protein